MNVMSPVVSRQPQIGFPYVPVERVEPPPRNKLAQDGTPAADSAATALHLGGEADPASSTGCTGSARTVLQLAVG